jgi:Tfp pilus assembly major pilin PilA
MEPNSSQYEELYSAAVGASKAGYYVPLFQRFDQPGSSRISWNWPAFFVSFFWLLYRRMYLLALAYFFLLPAALATLSTILSALFGPVAGGGAYLALLLAQLIAVPMFANALYHRHVRDRIRSLAVGAPSHEAVVQRLVGSSSGGAPAVVAVAAVVGVMFFGILAAIAIPAYQDYTIRSQVVEGLNLSGPLKASLAQRYAAGGDWPADLASVGLDGADYAGQYVRDMDVSGGVILIHYGNAANPRIAGHTLSLHPASAADGNIEWLCGYAAGSDAGGTDIPPKYLPRGCRGGADPVERL